MHQKGIKDNLKESGGINITMNTNKCYFKPEMYETIQREQSKLTSQILCTGISTFILPNTGYTFC